MAESVYKVVELVGTSTESWEKAAKAAVDRAAESLRDLRVAEVVEQDMVIEKGKVSAYRAKVKLSFKYEGGGGTCRQVAARSTRCRGGRTGHRHRGGQSRVLPHQGEALLQV